jgi:hypothetical protein
MSTLRTKEKALKLGLAAAQAVVIGLSLEFVGIVEINPTGWVTFEDGDDMFFVVGIPEIGCTGGSQALFPSPAMLPLHSYRHIPSRPLNHRPCLEKYLFHPQIARQIKNAHAVSPQSKIQLTLWGRGWWLHGFAGVVKERLALLPVVGIKNLGHTVG